MTNQKIVVSYDKDVTLDQQKLFDKFVKDNLALGQEIEVEGIGGGIKNPKKD
jgi:hypothetical protein